MGRGRVFVLCLPRHGRSPLYLRGKSPGRAQISAEFKYTGTGGAFSGLNGNVTTAMLSALFGEAATAGAVPIYGTVDGSGNVTGLISPKRVAIAGAGGSGLPIGSDGDVATVVNGQWVSSPRETVIGQALAGINFTPTVPADNVTSVQDQQVTGNVLTDVTTITGTPRVTDYTIAGTKYTAGVSSTTNPLGTFVLRQNGTWTLDPVLYTSGAMPQITYTVSNGIATETGTLNITLTHVNHAPTAGADSGSSTGSAVTINVLSNDTDPDSDTLTITKVNATNVTAGGSAVSITNGTVALNAQGTGLVVTPAGGFTTGTLSFNYTISDGNGATTTGAVTVTVSPAQAGGTSNWVMGTTTVVPFNWATNIIAKNATKVEPTTGATIKRLTDVTQDMPGQIALYNAYSRYTNENITGEYVLAFASNSTSCLVIDRATGAVVASLAHDNTGLASHTIGAAHEIRWHYTGAHPYRVYFVRGTQFWMIDDVRDQANTRTLIKDFGSLIDWAGTENNSRCIYMDQEGNSSLDSDHWAWMAAFYDSGAGMFVARAFVHYQVSTDTIHTMYPSGLAGFTSSPTGESARTTFSIRPNMVEMAPDGSGIVIHHMRAYSGWLDAYINSNMEAPYFWPRDFNPATFQPFRLSSDATHSGWSSVSGAWYFVSQDNRRDKWCAVPIAGANRGYGNEGQIDVTVALGSRVIDFHTDGGIYPGMHFGVCTNAADGWTLVSTYSTTPLSTNGIANSLFMMEIKPEGQARKWFLGPACNLTPGSKADYNEAPASINIAGTRVATSGDWGGAAPQAVGGPYDGERYIDMYEITLPTNWQSHWV